MSGSGGGGTWVNQPTDDCATLAQQTSLNSPNRGVLQQLKPGVLLEVRVNKIGKAVVVEAVYNGEVAGSVTSSIIQKLAECIEKGHEYVHPSTPTSAWKVRRVTIDHLISPETP